MEMSGAVVSWCVVVSTSSYVRSAGERTDHQDDDTGTIVLVATT